MYSESGLVPCQLCPRHTYSGAPPLGKPASFYYCWKICIFQEDSENVLLVWKELSQRNSALRQLLNAKWHVNRECSGVKFLNIKKSWKILVCLLYVLSWFWRSVQFLKKRLKDPFACWFSKNSSFNGATDFSVTGMEPCSPCPMHHYQPDLGQQR